MSAIRDGDFEEAQAFALVAIYDLLFEHLTGKLKPHPPRLRGQTEADAPEPAPTERSAGSRDAQARERDEVTGGVGQEDTPSE